jgi:hypothetical protein
MKSDGQRVTCLSKKIMRMFVSKESSCVMVSGWSLRWRSFLENLLESCVFGKNYTSF